MGDRNRIVPAVKDFGLKPTHGIRAGRLLLHGSVTSCRLRGRGSDRPTRVISVPVSRAQP